MATDSVPAGGDPHRLLAHSRHLAHRVRLAQRVTWFPLLVLAAVTFAAIPVDRYGHRVVNCRAVGAGVYLAAAQTVAYELRWRFAPPWDLLPHLVILGGVLLLGGLGFALAQRPWRHR